MSEDRPYEVFYTKDPRYDIAGPREVWEGLPALAQRLGVEPNTGDGNVHLAMRDGTKYDLFLIVNRLLDRIDQTLEKRDDPGGSGEADGATGQVEQVRPKG